MNMDSIPIEAPFAATFPLPFRVLILAGVGIFCWATNLHGLHLLGVDAASALEFRSHDPYGLPHTQSLRHGLTIPGPPDSIALARAVYRLCASYAFVVFTGWAVFHVVTRGELFLVDVFKWVPAVTMLVVLMCTVTPFNVFERRVRDMFLASVRRCLFSSRTTPVYFCDVVLADIFTSFAIVIGDVWLSLCMIMPGGSLLIFPQQYGWTRLMIPCLLSVPYAVRFRQCIIDYMQPTTTDKKQLYNALKYATSFPVIFLSAAQREIASEATHKAEIEEHPLFRLWLLSVAVNSLYSFWWDVTNDWGLEFLKPRHISPRQPPKPLLLPALQARRSSSENYPPLHSRRTSLDSQSHIQTHPSHPSSSSYAWGLRPVLVFPLPAYPIAIFANLILRFTWSLKISAHLRSQVSGALLFFWLEVAELVRRWVWVFFRVEWECIRREMERTGGEGIGMQVRRRGGENGGDEENEAYGLQDGVEVSRSGMELSGADRTLFDESRDKRTYEDGLA